MENFKTEDILKTLLPHWKKLITVLIVSVLVGIFISSEMVIKPLYKSYAIVYPVNLSPSSEESNTEQLLQWFNSEEVKKAVRKKFDLYNHYNIDTLEKRHETYFNLKYKELVSINATLYESIEISVKDQSPEMAQNIVNGIIDAVNDLITDIRRERLNEYIINNQEELELENKKADSLKLLIDNIRKEYNIVDVTAQAKILLKKKHKSGGEKSLNESENQTLNGITNKVTDLNTLGTIYSSQLGTYNYFRNEVNKFKFEHNSHISYTNVVSKPTLPDSKCYPIRSLIIAIISLSSLLIACIVIIFLNINKQQID
jgi:capsule polysaccharide export protein KpsE/RkpR